jgi:hypothetical protein
VVYLALRAIVVERANKNPVERIFSSTQLIDVELANKNPVERIFSSTQLIVKR